MDAMGYETHSRVLLQFPGSNPSGSFWWPHHLPSFRCPKPWNVAWRNRHWSQIRYQKIHHACMSNSCGNNREIRKKAHVQPTMSHWRSNMLHVTLKCDDEFSPHPFLSFTFLPCYTNVRCNQNISRFAGRSEKKHHDAVQAVIKITFYKNPWQIKRDSMEYQMKALTLIWVEMGPDSCIVHYIILQLIIHKMFHRFICCCCCLCT